jgi:hypothetical protein
MPKEIRFQLPEGFSVPEGHGEGDHIDVLATLELEADGRACLKEIDGHAMPGYDEDGDKRSYPQAAADEFDKMKTAQQAQPTQGGY